MGVGRGTKGGGKGLDEETGEGSVETGVELRIRAGKGNNGWEEEEAGGKGREGGSGVFGRHYACNRLLPVQTCRSLLAQNAGLGQER